MYGAMKQDDDYEIDGKLFPELVADAILSPPSQDSFEYDEEAPLSAEEQRRAYNRDQRDRKARTAYFQKRRELLRSQKQQEKSRHQTRLALATPLQTAEYAQAFTCSIVVGLIVFGVIFGIALLMIRGGIKEIEKF